jgi:hypothetical protein
VGQTEKALLLLAAGAHPNAIDRMARLECACLILNQLVVCKWRLNSVRKCLACSRKGECSRYRERGEALRAPNGTDRKR